MKTKLSLSSTFLTLSGLILMGLGLYFIFIRPPLLPEDPRFMGTSLDQIRSVIPGLLIWLRRVFWVMGGYMFAAGLLTSHVALTAFRARTKGAPLVMALAGLSSIGWMAIVNFMIDSDLKWLLLTFNLPWILALILSWGERRQA